MIRDYFTVETQKGSGCKTVGSILTFRAKQFFRYEIEIILSGGL